MFDIDIFLCGVYVIQNFAFTNFIFSCCWTFISLRPFHYKLVPPETDQKFCIEGIAKVSGRKKTQNIIFLTWLRIPRDAKLGATNVNLDIMHFLHPSVKLLEFLPDLYISFGSKTSAEFELLPK